MKFLKLNNLTMIDRINIECGIREIANKIFITSEITESDIEIFINEIIIFVENEFDSYVRKNEKELVHFIMDEKKKEAFCDFSVGYVRKMQDWMDENPLEVKKTEIPVETIVENMSDKTAIKKALLSAGIGTIVAVGISFFTSSLIAFFAELIVLGIAYKVYKENNNLTEIKRMKPNMESLKEQIIINVSNDITSWLDKAQFESEKLFQSYK